MTVHGVEQRPSIQQGYLWITIQTVTLALASLSETSQQKVLMERFSFSSSELRWFQGKPKWHHRSIVSNRDQRVKTKINHRGFSPSHIPTYRDFCFFSRVSSLQRQLHISHGLAIQASKWRRCLFINTQYLSLKTTFWFVKVAGHNQSLC